MLGLFRSEILSIIGTKLPFIYMGIREELCTQPQNRQQHIPCEATISNVCFGVDLVLFIQHRISQQCCYRDFSLTNLWDINTPKPIPEYLWHLLRPRFLTPIFLLQHPLSVRSKLPISKKKPRKKKTDLKNRTNLIIQIIPLQTLRLNNPKIHHISNRHF